MTDSERIAALERRIDLMEKRLSAQTSVNARLYPDCPSNEHLVQVGDHSHTYIGGDGRIASGGLVLTPVPIRPVDVIK